MSVANIDDVVDCIISAVRELSQDAFVQLHPPVLGSIEIDELRACVESTFVSSVGPHVNKFESLIADYVGTKFAISTVNGTSALSLALLASNILQGDEVLVPALTFVATANSVAHIGAIPHFLDAGVNSPNICPEKIGEYLSVVAEVRNGVCYNRETGRLISAIVPTHVFGHPVDMDGIIGVAETFKLAVIEDASESLGSFYRNQHTGTFGKCGVFSFNGNKIITTGGGGMIVSDDDSIASRALHLSTTAKKPHSWRYTHDEVGYNFRMPNVNAALGCAQMSRLGAIRKSKVSLVKHYRKFLDSKNLGMKLLEQEEHCDCNFWLQAVVLDEEMSKNRDFILEKTNNAGVMTRPLWDPLYTLPMYSQNPRMNMLNSDSWFAKVINIPSNLEIKA